MNFFFNLFRTDDRHIRDGLRRYVEMEYRAADREAAFNRLWKEARQ
jgi:hypothetical protein